MYSRWKVEVSIHCARIVKRKRGKNPWKYQKCKGKDALWPPPSILDGSFSTVSSQPTNPMKALICCVPPLYGFCNMSVNLCENCMQQYFLVYCFFPMWIVSLFFFFLFVFFPPPPFFLVNIYFFFFKKQTNWCVVDLYVTYSLGSYYRYVIRMDILLGFRMFYKKTNS